ncbi:MAG: formyltransferase family protein [Chitinophagaceae bacterium]
MKVAILTNSKLSVPALDFLAARKMLVAVGLPAREDKTEDADHIAFTAAHHQVPLATFDRPGFKGSLSEWIALHKPDVVLVFTFPFKIPVDCLNLPARGFINFHFGLLPEYRGADAIFWQIRNRASEGGVSVHQMNEEIDKGRIYFVHKIPLTPADTYGSHLLNLSFAGVAAAEKLLQLLASGTQPSIEQDESKAAYYKRPALRDVEIDWSQPAADIIALINACNPWNKGAVAYLNQYPIKIIAASMHSARSPQDVKPGTIILVDINKGCVVHCGSGESINLDILFCNDSFITGFQFASLGISQGMRFEKLTVG